ncbi:extracellular solute-binding protein [Halomicroarcula sp. S1AR25-4]|uniref:extracellular solute-binding protein n=1 Tax=Haloarcula sp. S1AR25-4 TaxID=2950538 RepID=UPI002874D85D|nr:extracellular solute-binding protein [Halomicroarcula sp. S1AR25-4]MDS0279426.1 extracellular solute-binding protein [Halomicroarcula sp. S1AR25-4]
MTMDRRTLIKHIGGVGAAAALAGCSVQEDTGDGSGSSDGESGGSTDSQGPAGTATAWYSLSESELAVREEVLSTFNEQSQHTIDGADISDLKKKTSSAIPAGEGPQIFDWAHDWAGNSYEQGFVVDQSDEVSVSLDTFTETAQSAVQYEGNLVGLPYGAETVTPIANTDIVDSVPESVDEMVSMMEEHHDPDNGQYGLAYPFDPYFTSAWLQAFDGYYFDPSAEEPLGINSEETVRGLQFALDNLAPYMPNDPNYEPQAAAFAEGNAAFTINGPWSLSGLNSNDISYEVFSFPEMSDGTPSPYTGISVWYFAKPMADGGAAAKAGRQFTEWFVTNEDHLLSLANEQGAIPVLSSLVGSSDLPVEVQAYSESAGQGVPMPSDPRMGDVWGPVENALVSAFNGDATAQKALDKAAEQIRSNWE